MQYSSSDSFELYSLPHRRRNESLFNWVFIFCVILFFLGGIYLKGIKPLQMAPDEKKIELIKTRFMLTEKKPEPKKSAAIPAKTASPQKPVDLTKPVVLGQKETEITQSPPSTGEPVRRVYGLRRIYSVGLGAGGSASEAVIGKIGNTLNKQIDTLTATPKELKGQLVSVTTITSMPVMESFVKPEYTDEMKKNGVNGSVSVKLLIDIDGRVKEAVVLSDLGFGTREAVLDAAKKLIFKPAMQGTTPAAVWIVFKFKFVLQE